MEKICFECVTVIACILELSSLVSERISCLVILIHLKLSTWSLNHGPNFKEREKESKIKQQLTYNTKI